MTAMQLNAELFRELSIIAEDEGLMKKAVKYLKKLTAQKQAMKPKPSANLSLKDVFADDDMGEQACLMCHL